MTKAVTDLKQANIQASSTEFKVSSKIIEESNYIIWRETEQLIRITYKRNRIVDLNDVMKINTVVTEMDNNDACQLLVDMRDILHIESSARRYVEKVVKYNHVRSAAMLVKSRLSIIMAKMMVMINRPPIPIRFFTDETAARQWLSAVSDKGK